MNEWQMHYLQVHPLMGEIWQMKIWLPNCVTGTTGQRGRMNVSFFDEGF